MTRFLLAVLLCSFASAAFGGPAPKNHGTTTIVNCFPDPGVLGSTSTCTAEVSDIPGGGGGTYPPTGDVTFATDSTGSFSAASCTLATLDFNTASCSVTYTINAFDSGTHTITADYAGAFFAGGPGGGIQFQPSSANTPLAINYPAATITGVVPAAGNRGEVVNVTVAGSNFVAGVTTLALGANITVSALSNTSSTQLTATLTIADAATVGLRDVTVTNSGPGGGSATLANGFDVRNPSPVIDNLAPAAVEVGSGPVTVTINGSGFVSDSVAYFNGAPRTTTFVNSTQLQINVTATDTGTIGDYPVHVENPVPGGGTSNTATFSVLASGGSFDTVEPTTALGSAMFTKLAGVAFGVDVLATELSRLSVDTSFTGTVKIELLDAGDDSAGLDAGGCRASWVTVQTLPDAAFTAADNGRISVNTAYANALRIGRFRISYPATGTPTHVGCSSDPFSIRPTSLGVSSPLTNTSTVGTPMHAAGAAFTITATAIPGYDGTPQLDTSFLGVPIGVEGTLGGGFAAADPVSGISTGNSFTYSEVGNFTLAPGGIVDNSFTAVDQPADCAPGSSNTLTGGKYGCDFASAANLDVGRFTPAYFDVDVEHACTDAGGFTYSGQPFKVTVTAYALGGTVTQNYEGLYAKDVTLSDAGDASNFEPGTNFISGSLFANGTVDNTVTTYSFPSTETTYTTISMRAADTDTVSSAGHLEESTEIRSGRLVIDNSTAITTNDGLMSVMLQTWQETSPGIFEWAVHAADTSCTTPAIGDFSFDVPSFSGNLASGETSISEFFFNAGQGALTLSAPGTGNDGSVNILGATDTWLHYDQGSGTPAAPSGTMTFFEIFSSEDGFIERHEVIP